MALCLSPTIYSTVRNRQPNRTKVPSRALSGQRPPSQQWSCKTPTEVKQKESETARDKEQSRKEAAEVLNRRMTLVTTILHFQPSEGSAWCKSRYNFLLDQSRSPHSHTRLCRNPHSPATSAQTHKNRARSASFDRERCRDHESKQR